MLLYPLLMVIIGVWVVNCVNGTEFFDISCFIGLSIRFWSLFGIVFWKKWTLSLKSINKVLILRNIHENLQIMFKYVVFENDIISFAAKFFASAWEGGTNF